MYMLDTNVVSYFLRNNLTIVKQLRAIDPRQICISAVTASELVYGVAKRQNKQLAELVENFLASIQVCDWTGEVADTYGKLRAEMETSGKIMSVQDQMIAAHALTLGITLVTSDLAFQMVPNLKLENWLH